jgi:hypothetical protein
MSSIISVPEFGAHLKPKGAPCTLHLKYDRNSQTKVTLPPLRK